MSSIQYGLHDLFKGLYLEKVFKVIDVDQGRFEFLTPFEDGDTTFVNQKYICRTEGYDNGSYGVASMIVDDERKTDAGVDSVVMLKTDELALYMTTEFITKETAFVSDFLKRFYEVVYNVNFNDLEIDFKKVLKEASKYDFIKLTPTVSPDDYQAILDTKSEAIKEFHGKKTSFISGETVDFDNVYDMVETIRLAMPEAVDNGIKELQINEGVYLIPQHIQDSLPAIQNMFHNNLYPIVLAVGASGTGKSTVAEVYARLFGVEYCKFDVPNVLEVTDLFYTRAVSDGQTVAEATNLLLAFLRGNCVVLLDEVNRVPTNLTNALFGVLDHNKALILNQPDLAKSALLTQEEKEIVSTPNGFHIADNIMIVATANIGYGFAGTFELDEAFLNRFAITEVFSTPTKNEVVDIVSRRSGLEFDISNKIVSVVIDLEKQVQQENMSADCTIRAMLNVAKLVYNGLTIRQAIDRAIINPVSVRYPHGIKPLVEYLNTILPPNVLKV